MIICELCKQPIKYISNRGIVITCEVNEEEIFTNTGRAVKGYKKHFCKGGNDGQTKGWTSENESNT